MRLGGRYEVLDTLQSRGPIRVVRAYDTRDQLSVIIRTMPVTAAEMEEFVRFQEEAAVIASLNHPNIWRVLRTFIDEGVTCLVVEDVEGRTLADILRSGRMPLARVKFIALQIASALAYGHDRGIIHRNLEPENVMVTSDDVVKLRDLIELGRGRLFRGAAIPMASPNPRADLYASPEQREGRTVGPQTDVYSLGALLFHMVNGLPPFDDTIYSGTMRFRDDVPLAWQSVIARAMARSEQFRIASAVELGQALEALPAPGAPAMSFQAPIQAKRCPACGREGRGRFCAGCGTALEV
jgi:eukaryotic-like serine/threonine-protein kinase